MENLYFNTFDGNKIFYRKWNFKKDKKTLIIIHRGHEHSERLNELTQDKKFLKYNIFAYDLRGHGYTETKTSPNAMDYVRDLDSFVKHLKNEYQIKEENIFIVANSIGGVILSAYIHDFAPNIAGMALLAPAFEIKLYIPFAKQLVTLLTKIKKDAKVMSYVKAKVLTHDVAEQNKYNSDKLINKEINAKLLIDLADMGKKLVEDSMAIELPTIIFSAEKDYVVKNSAQKKFFLNLSSKKREFIELENFYHGIIFEKERQKVYKMLDDFIQDVFKNQNTSLDTSPREFSRKEYERIALKEYPLNEKIFYSIQKFSMRTFGFLSKGMSLGLKYGFDSGISLDYIYKNQADGNLLLGKFIDRFYLNQIGWAGIRERKKNLLTLIEEKINSLGEENVKILDVAGGTGNYLFDIKEKYPNVQILINEFKKSNIEVGEEVIKKNNWENISFVNYDCFDKETYKKINYTPNIVIISGVFELFENNKMLENTISGVAEILDKNGAVIYTGQPWHPQLKQIALVLNSHKGHGKSWLMRRRSEKELDSLFENYNLKKEKMLIDNDGIFTVSLAELR
ncbi:bifunctional alpha/beta hydrolase/class I SAM-dependent methyltransferase [Fusobacterium sp. oral taxon 203]|uniref:bifunctional alpha/beta hydrolase/class I SAM-dependent methyltransferase n=1 Tax=Fusobacterium sp. oral taxon 203 TaxID=671211 RepID=UPI000B928887|nr:alpha/beta fold hydrolase [Fusobacterium sp. oral taxon 203]ASS39625.1 methyltransferase [Fusobacterium sp. oral taxon 203]